MKGFTGPVETLAQPQNKPLHFLMESVEKFLPVLKAKGAEFVVLYRGKSDESLVFYDDYKSFYDSTQMRKYWQKHGYVIAKVWDLDYIEEISDRERARQRRKTKSTIGD